MKVLQFVRKGRERNRTASKVRAEVKRTPGSAQSTEFEFVFFSRGVLRMITRPQARGLIRRRTLGDGRVGRFRSIMKIARNGSFQF